MKAIPKGKRVLWLLPHPLWYLETLKTHAICRNAFKTSYQNVAKSEPSVWLVAFQGMEADAVPTDALIEWESMMGRECRRLERLEDLDDPEYAPFTQDVLLWVTTDVLGDTSGEGAGRALHRYVDVVVQDAWQPKGWLGKLCRDTSTADEQEGIATSPVRTSDAEATPVFMSLWGDEEGDATVPSWMDERFMLPDDEALSKALSFQEFPVIRGQLLLEDDLTHTMYIQKTLHAMTQALLKPATLKTAFRQWMEKEVSEDLVTKTLIRPRATNLVLFLGRPPKNAAAFSSQVRDALYGLLKQNRLKAVIATPDAPLTACTRRTLNEMDVPCVSWDRPDALRDVMAVLATCSWDTTYVLALGNWENVHPWVVGTDALKTTDQNAWTKWLDSNKNNLALDWMAYAQWTQWFSKKKDAVGSMLINASPRWMSNPFAVIGMTLADRCWETQNDDDGATDGGDGGDLGDDDDEDGADDDDGHAFKSNIRGS